MERIKKNCRGKWLAIEKTWEKHDIYYHPCKNYFIEMERHESQEVGYGICNKILKQI